MNIGLIYCPYGEGDFNTFGKSHWTSQIHPGLCSISAYAKRKGYRDIALIDVRKLSGWEHFRQELIKKKFDVVGVTMMSSDFNKATKAIKVIKEVNRETVVVAGGVHPTVAPDEVASNKNVDHVVVGEGEITFVNILDSLKNNKAMERILYGTHPVLDELPFEDRELFDYKVTTGFVSNFPGIFKAPSVTIIASRGCPYKCTFCAPHATTMYGPRVRYRSVDNVIEELKILREKYHFNSIFFWDYSITLNKAWMYEFAEKYKANGFKALISANARADAICRNEDAIKELSKVGFKMLHIGYESGSQRMLDFMKKGITVEESLRATEICKKNGIIVRGLFMLGLPTETKDDIQKTMDFIKKAQPQVYSFSYFTPVPGSTLYDYCKEKDLSLIKNHDELADYGPSKPKIKGVDYEYLRTVVEESFGLKFRSRLIGKMMLLVHTKLKRGKTRYFFIWLYSKWVKFTMGRVSKP
jgi:radical SAM superfamily enzyme YgiQ (UPF0313 family)